MRSSTTTALALFLAGLAGTLAVPVPRGELAETPAPADAPPVPDPARAVFAALVADATLDPATKPATAEHRQRLDTLRALGPHALAHFLEQAVAETATEGARLAALECLEGCATRDEVAALVCFATPDKSASATTSPSTSPSGRLPAALRSALVPTLQRDARAFGELVGAWRNAGTELRGELLAAVAERGDPAGLALLAWVATFEGAEFHRAVAEACLPIAVSARDPKARRDLETLCVLLESEDSVCVQTISIALARGRVEAAIPAWIELLASSSRGTRERARRSLETLSGLALGATGERWQAWLDAESSWFEEQASLALSALDSDDDARVLAALRELSRHRLHADELVASIGELLVHESPAVRLCACSALQSLGSTLAIPALTGALGDEDQAVARLAWSTLRNLTGLDLPLDEELWREKAAGS